MKIYACYIVLNESDWLKLSIDSIYDFVDGIIILEGATIEWKFAISPEGLSVDNTSEIIKTYPDVDKKITYRQIGWVSSQPELRNMYLDMLPRKGEWIMMIDGDEMYHLEELYKMKRMLEEYGTELGVMYINHLFFFGDIYHTRYEEWKSMHGQCVPKIYRNHKYLHYDGKNTVSMAGMEGKPGRFSEIRFHHYGYARSQQRLLDKCLWTKKRWLAHGAMPELRDLNDDELRLILMHTHPLLKPTEPLPDNLLKFMDYKHEYTTKENTAGIIEFRGEHAHPDVEKRWEEIK